MKLNFRALRDYGGLIVHTGNAVITKQVLDGNCVKYPNKKGSSGTIHPKPSGNLQNLFLSESEKIFSFS